MFLGAQTGVELELELDAKASPPTKSMPLAVPSGLEILSADVRMGCFLHTALTLTNEHRT